MLLKKKYRIHNAPNPAALKQAQRVGSNMAIIYSIGPCSHLRFDKDPVNGRLMDEFPIFFDEYPKIAELRHSSDAVWLDPFRRHLTAMCDQSLALGMTPVFHLYEPQLPLAFETEYPDLVGVYKRKTQNGTVDVHTMLDPDKPATWDLVKSKYRELARDFPKVGMYVITTGDIAGVNWCLPKAKMSVADRLANLVKNARDGVREFNPKAKICFRLWWRNFPKEVYLDSHKLIAEMTGLENAAELMNPIARPFNDPTVVLPALFDQLPKDVPVMYKSTRMDIHNGSPITHVLGTYPKKLEQIIEVSFEQYHVKSYPWCKTNHIRQGLKACEDYNLAGYVSLPINMGNNELDNDPESGNIGRMNTSIFEKMVKDIKRSDRDLLTEWLTNEYGATPPDVVLDALLDADRLADEGLQWGRGINERMPFASLHTTKLYWCFDGFIQPDFPYAMLNPTAELLESMIKMKHDAYIDATNHIAAIYAAGGSINERLYKELLGPYKTFADVIMLRRDWASYTLMQYGIEKGVFPADRKTDRKSVV